MLLFYCFYYLNIGFPYNVKGPLMFFRVTSPFGLAVGTKHKGMATWNPE